MKLFFSAFGPLLRGFAPVLVLLALVVFTPAAIGCRGSAPPRPAPPPASSSSSSSAPSAPSCVAGRTFFLLRHAEKATTDKDTPLSAAGRERAERIATLLAATRITRVVASPRRRTQETVAPLAEQHGLPVEIGPATDKVALLAELQKAPDGAALVVATHSDVLPYVVRELGKTPLRGVPGDELSENDFGRLAVVTVPCAGRPIVVELSTGT